MRSRNGLNERPAPLLRPTGRRSTNSRPSTEGVWSTAPAGCPALGCCVPSAFPLLPLLLGCSMAARQIGLKRTCWAGLPAVDLRALPLLTGEGVGLGLSAPARRQAPMMSVRPSPLLLASLLPWLAGVLPLPHLLPLPRRAGALLRLLTWFPFLLPRLRRLLILLNLTPTRTMMSVWATLASKPAMAPLPSVPGPQFPLTWPPGPNTSRHASVVASGDCAYTSIAHALVEHAGKTTSKKDLAPGGRLQAQLRLLASKELAKHPERYYLLENSDLAAATARAGVFADSVSLSALAAASNLELRVWARSEDSQRWDLYVIGPSGRPPKSPQVIWLKLQSVHYQLLQPCAALPPAVAQAWLDGACWKAEMLKGGGPDGLDPDALELLGLSPPGMTPLRWMLTLAACLVSGPVCRLRPAPPACLPRRRRADASMANPRPRLRMWTPTHALLPSTPRLRTLFALAAGSRPCLGSPAAVRPALIGVSARVGPRPGHRPIGATAKPLPMPTPRVSSCVNWRPSVAPPGQMSFVRNTPAWPARSANSTYDVPVYVTTAKYPYFAYTCRVCGKVQKPALLKRQLCRANDGVDRASFMRASVGGKKFARLRRWEAGYFRDRWQQRRAAGPARAAAKSSPAPRRRRAAAATARARGPAKRRKLLGGAAE